MQIYHSSAHWNILLQTNVHCANYLKPDHKDNSAIYWYTVYLLYMTDCIYDTSGVGKVWPAG